jgi:hypothetical protein
VLLVLKGGRGEIPAAATEKGGTDVPPLKDHQPLYGMIGAFSALAFGQTET